MMEIRRTFLSRLGTLTAVLAINPRLYASQQKTCNASTRAGRQLALNAVRAINTAQVSAKHLTGGYVDLAILSGLEVWAPIIKRQTIVATAAELLDFDSTELVPGFKPRFQLSSNRETYVFTLASLAGDFAFSTDQTGRIYQGTPLVEGADASDATQALTPCEPIDREWGATSKFVSTAARYASKMSNKLIPGAFQPLICCCPFCFHCEEACGCPA